ncbi:MAG: hypothetical protein ACKVXR_01115 [Planctomycetota bacterium]
MSLLRTIAALVLAASAGLGSQGADDRPAPTLESLRARWERFSPEQKERARARYERYLAMSEEERAQLAQSARALRERVERVQEELEAKAPARVAGLAPEKRREIVREIVAEESRELGASIRARVPAQWIEQIRNAPPEERARLLRRFQRQQLARVARFAIGELGRRLELPGEEIARMQALPAEDRGRVVLELRQRLSALDAGEHGLPPGITPAEWDTWLALSPEEFFEVFQRYWLTRVESVDASKGRLQSARELLEAARPRVEEVLALADLTPAERGARLAGSKRARCMQVLRARELLTASELQALEGKSHDEFFEQVRQILRPR